MASLPSSSSKFPAFNIIQPTPPRSYKQNHRLLYRGSLSLPDSDLVLDGKDASKRGFVADSVSRDHIHGAPPPASPTVLLESPVALALESMRGRPSLRFVSCVNLADVPYECTGEISM